MARLERGGFALHYEVVGEGFPLVLLPGAAADGSAWRAGFVSLLEREFACVLFDPPGMGSSDVPSDLKEWGVGAIAEDVVALADELGFDRFALWGASAGGAAATIVAAEHPGRVAALVLSGAWPADQEQWREYFESTAADVRAWGGMETLARLFAGEELALPDWARESAPDGEMVARMLEGLLMTGPGAPCPSGSPFRR
jgi:pimeloyl-ACP methyl ester carboxylesterase